MYDVATFSRALLPGFSLKVMMLITRLAAFAVALVLLASPASAQNTVMSAPPATFTLPNGLQVLVIQDHRTPVVTEMVWYKVGSADETPGKSGLVQLFANLLFNSTG